MADIYTTKNFIVWAMVLKGGGATSWTLLGGNSTSLATLGEACLARLGLAWLGLLTVAS